MLALWLQHPTLVVLRWLIEFSILLGLWLLFAFSVGRNELIAGAAAALFATLAAELVRLEEQPKFIPDLRWILAFVRVPRQVIIDTGLLIRKLAGIIFGGDRRTGEFVSLPFAETGNDARCTARRALSILYTTLPPNTIVIGIDRRKKSILLHRLVPVPVSQEPR